MIQKWGQDAPALVSVGYKQLCAFERGEVGWHEAVELWKITTRQYTKRQMTWFRGQTNATWLDATKPQEELVREVLGNTLAAPQRTTEEF